MASGSGGGYSARLVLRIVIIRDSDAKAVLNELGRIGVELARLTERIAQMATTITEQLNALEAAVTANTDAEQSAITLLQRIPQLILDAANAGGVDPAALARITAVTDALKAKATDLAAAVVANTPVVPPPGFTP